MTQMTTQNTYPAQCKTCYRFYHNHMTKLDVWKKGFFANHCYSGKMYKYKDGECPYYWKMKSLNF